VPVLGQQETGMSKISKEIFLFQPPAICSPFIYKQHNSDFLSADFFEQQDPSLTPSIVRVNICRIFTFSPYLNFDRFWHYIKNPLQPKK
jgi:hypothetical protein